MLCGTCHRQLERGSPRCRNCGTPTGIGVQTLDLVLPDGERVPLEGALNLGRAAGNDIQLEDPSISRQHARLRRSDHGAMIEDLGSSYGTQLDGRPVRDPTPVGEGNTI